MPENVAGSTAPLVRAGEWLSMRQVIQEILNDTPEPRIAFAISGGGATGAYEAGAIEAWLRCLASDFPGKGDVLQPQFILGSSAGALNATTLLVQRLRPKAGAAFGFNVWTAISPRSAGFVVGWRRSALVDLATRWVKMPWPILLLGVAVLLAAFLLLVNPVLTSLFLRQLPLASGLAALIAAHPLGASTASAVGSIAVVLVLAFLFHRSAFRNRDLKRTIANVLTGRVDPKSGRVTGSLLRASCNIEDCAESLVRAWWNPESGTRRPNFIVTTTDLSGTGDNLFTLVEPEVYARLADHGWQVMQASPDGGTIGDYTSLSGRCGWVKARDFVTCVVASTSIPGVFPSQRITLHSTNGSDAVEHDFVDGGVLNNSPIHIAMDAGATHVISFELDPLRQHDTFQYLAEGDEPSLGRNLIQTFETLVSHSTSQGIHTASAWNRELVSVGAGDPKKRLVPIFRFAPRRRELNLIDFNGHYASAFSRARPTLEGWLNQGLLDASTERLFWRATFQADPTSLSVAGPAGGAASATMPSGSPDLSRS